MSDSDLSFEELRIRLDEIVEAVSDEALPLEEALDLYEEAVGIGLQASRIMEEGITTHDAEDQGNQGTSESSASLESSSDVA